MRASEWLRPPVASATGSGCGVWSPETSVGAEEEVRRLTALRQEGILSRLFSSPSDRDARRPSIQAQLVHAPAPVMAGRRGSSMGSYEGNGEGRRGSYSPR